MKGPKITFIGAGSTIFVKNILGDVFHKPALKEAQIALMDIDEVRLEESHLVVKKLMESAGATGTITSYLNQKEALRDADFVVIAFQIGGYDPCTITDFEVCKRHGLEQTIADTLGPGGIMRSLRTVPHLWRVCEDMTEVCPNATMLNYVNPMAMNTWAMYEMYPHIKQVGLCHSVQGTAEELARVLDIDVADLRYTCAGINHMAYYLTLEKKIGQGEYVDIYPDLLQAFADGSAPKSGIHNNGRCENLVRYEMFKKLGYFVTESSEHFAEYTPYFIKPNRPDLIERYKVPLDEYPKRCVEQISQWKTELEAFKNAEQISVKQSNEYASTIINSIWTGTPSVIYGNVKNEDLIGNLPTGCCVEVACLVDANGIQPTKVGRIPNHLAALMQTNINVQTLLTEAIVTQNRERIYHAAMLDPHTSATLGLEEIYALVDDLIDAHGSWLPDWVHQ
ncbi:alpha-glucosidase/alpha-galactosidase [Vibrio parahaemolyticus]|uniref:alpha-glucosidase/alpha-galactosidase n=1 Tax=Vibrio parahaemolyticus TaxID=670 RepID=UPI00047217FC|nr:alpha-glucosidase/alpha-galactosidase [Vibrio parahaemolyticus]EHK0750976.1 alpha-glucosidase/alpha-galactosidase [Vibrio parahaemolyticus]EHK0753842.1 alpha-glucosidase/alpha-galactosidase [Vibrio parahaemolyticus]EJE4175791.1 alpha-glucosidase/alpha-galactosidase [Vibrio parahaemolyticus]MCR9783500.1 alpha-glucosidase/alpha-galactosidase [Vibrio parahaemolyticus]MDF4650791.1 alpha-glucosidase/alpha-galactosidase [Vibrio parahaemolyticus]